MVSTSPPAQSTPAAGAAAPTLSPAALDTIPVLTTILSRLSILTAPVAGGTSSPTHAPPSTDGLLHLKDVPAATDSLRHTLQKARVTAAQLPDIDRAISEQEEEIQELLERIQRQTAVLQSLRDAGVGFRQDKADAMET